MKPGDAPRDVLALYEEVERLTGGMLHAAHRADWDRLIELEAGCANCIEALKGCPVPTQLSDTARRQKVALIRQILSNDREIRKITEPWMQYVSQLLDSAQTGCQVAKTYGEP